MDKLRIRNIDVLHENEVLLELSDGRSLTFSLPKLLTLVPDDVLTDDEDEQGSDTD